MNYEKKYKEALERARALKEKSKGMILKKWLWGVFPELKESEDERIRRELIEHIKANKEADYVLFKKFSPEDVVINLLEKQGENKHTDEVESKFHEGEWIIHQGTENIYQVVACIDNQYQLKYGDNYTLQKCTDVDRCARLWTIADAKDGDVLQLQHEGMEHVIIYKRLVKKNFHTILSVHCAYDGSTNDFFEDVDSYHCITSERDEKEIHPATKEQRDTLFAKMKEVGYEWDANKKELKKIEPKPLNANKVIEWLDKQACLGWLEDVEVEKVVEQFKKDFGL